mmetsp:Transcript_2173/g.3356  ORF Transcript_2173/g.3356 Transcript_2173/m.3356 type:complete len:187 (-) Transcript_2173:45-605(-)
MCRHTQHFCSYRLPRLDRYVVTGLGSGVLWSLYYDAADGIVTHATADIVLRTAMSMAAEQFAWCPLLYGLYLIPLSTLLNGGLRTEISKQIQSRLPGLLIANAKVWTPANLIIYNVPLEWRVLTSNAVDLIWASICADVAADCGAEDSDACSVSLSQLEAGQIAEESAVCMTADLSVVDKVSSKAA